VARLTGSVVFDATTPLPRHTPSLPHRPRRVGADRVEEEAIRKSNLAIKIYLLRKIFGELKL
jgi:hypothetical protein